MHQALSILAATTTTVAGTKKSTSANYSLLFIVLIFAAAYFLFIRPRQQRLRQQQTAARQMAVGDEVVSAGGIHGRLVSLSDDLAEVEVAPGVVLTFLRRAISARPGAPGNPPESTTADQSSSAEGTGTPELEETDHPPPSPGEAGEEPGHDGTDRPSGAGDPTT